MAGEPQGGEPAQAINFDFIRGHDLWQRIKNSSMMEWSVMICTPVHQIVLLRRDDITVQHYQ
jgi:hypothetical protein